MYSRICGTASSMISMCIKANIQGLIRIMRPRASVVEQPGVFLNMLIPPLAMAPALWGEFQAEHVLFLCAI